MFPEKFTVMLHFFPTFSNLFPAENSDIGIQFSMKAHATVLITYDRISYFSKTYY